MMREVVFDDVKETDSILIGTENNIYRFSMIDASERRGTLTGGRLGNGLYEAIAFGSITGNDSPNNRDFSGLRTDYRAIFCVNKPQSGLQRFITSAVTELTHVKNNE